MHARANVVSSSSAESSGASASAKKAAAEVAAAAASAGISVALLSRLARASGPQEFLVLGGLGCYACGSAALGTDYLADFVDPEV